jgi:hypothetical protein
MGSQGVNNMKNNLSRREMLGIGVAAGTVLLGSCTREKPNMEFPWEYKILDSSKTKELAYKNYFKDGCMYGVFTSIASQVAEKLGEPYISFPFGISSYGGGGVAMWGTLCGTCNGAAMIIGLFQQGKIRNQLINEIFTWYEETSLPLFVPSQPVKVKPGFEMKTSRADSTLCHLSITKWTNISGFESYHPQRVERCARLVADMAGKTVELLNSVDQKKYAPKQQISAVSDSCLTCHAQGQQAPNEPEVVSRMKCTTCHDDAHYQDKE